ncbi:MAG TPA: peptide-methionine (S)-S-oxide reductase, partial [Candidatus Binataceae bacterium]|nr:peptide-methionine (S)-S-oxide reductase [Candidatus Binataceae bacterium]
MTSRIRIFVVWAIAAPVMMCGLGARDMYAADGGQAGLEKATFAGGCFWSMQRAFDHVPGVTSTEVGYTGGTKQHPSYEQVSEGDTGHLESIEVTFDPKKT